MAWSIGSKILSDIVTSLTEHVQEDSTRHSVYFDLVALFEEYGCDTLNECRGEDPLLDEVLYDAGIIDLDEKDDDEDEEEGLSGNLDYY